MDRIVAATERLLRARAWEEISVADIAEASQTSTGSFYQRFASKDALLPFMYDLYNAEGDALWAARETEGGFKARTLQSAAAKFVAFGISAMTRMRWLLRAMAIYSRQHPGRVAESAKERSARIYRVAELTFAPHLDGPSADAKRRIRMMTYAIGTLIREYYLFGNAPLATAMKVDAKAFQRELTRMTVAYLKH